MIEDQSKLEKFPELTETVNNLAKFHRKARGRGPDKKPRKRRPSKDVLFLNKVIQRALQPDITSALLDEIWSHFSTANFNNDVGDGTYGTLEDVIALAKWLRSTYMTWLPEVPKCKKCGQPMEFSTYRKVSAFTFKPNPKSWTGYDEVSADKDTLCVKIERYVCTKCSEVELRSRENDVRLIMKTKTGRCGEMALLYVSFGLALGWKIRLIAAILGGNDHVWAEVWIRDKWYPVDVAAEDPERLIKDPYLFQKWNWNISRIYGIEPGKLSVDVSERYREPLPLPQKTLDANPKVEIPDGP